jgi:hypothetical protein
VTEGQFKALLAGAAPSSSASEQGSSSSSTTTPPVISINGDHPAHIHVGDTDADLGATITGPKADLNLGISTYVNGAPMNPIQLDTTQAATDTIAYVATDSAGLTSTTTTSSAE